MVLVIKRYGHPILRKRAKAVKRIDEKIKRLIEDMCETLSAFGAAGLSGNQVGKLLRVIVLKAENERNLVLINPKIISLSGKEVAQEGCLSFPGLFSEIERSQSVVAVGLNVAGEEVTIKASGLLARAIQHEVDHLDGILFIDRVTSKERKRMLDEWKRIKNEIQKA
jgi:peptide deformylase